MPRITFTRDFNWHVKDNVTIAYKADHEYPVTQACADAAIAAGAAKIDELERRPWRGTLASSASKS